MTLRAWVSPPSPGAEAHEPAWRGGDSSASVCHAEGRRMEEKSPANPRRNVNLGGQSKRGQKESSVDLKADWESVKTALITTGLTGRKRHKNINSNSSYWGWQPIRKTLFFFKSTDVRRVRHLITDAFNRYFFICSSPPCQWHSSAPGMKCQIPLK